MVFTSASWARRFLGFQKICILSSAVTDTRFSLSGRPSLIAHHSTLCCAILPATQWEWISLACGEIEIIYYHRLLKYGGIAALEVDSQDGGIQMCHVISTDEVG